MLHEKSKLKIQFEIEQIDKLIETYSELLENFAWNNPTGDKYC